MSSFILDSKYMEMEIFHQCLAFLKQSHIYVYSILACYTLNRYDDTNSVSSMLQQLNCEKTCCRRCMDSLAVPSPALVQKPNRQWLSNSFLQTRYFSTEAYIQYIIYFLYHTSLEHSACTSGLPGQPFFKIQFYFNNSMFLELLTLLSPI